MNLPQHPLWQRHLVEAAVSYFNQRQVQTCLLVDNQILKDGVLQAQSPDGRQEFLICVAPYFVTQMDFADHDLSTTIKFDGLIHTLCIPYHAIKAVLACDGTGILTDEGHLNVIDIPPVVYPPGAHYRRTEQVDQSVVDSQPLEVQPSQDNIRRARYLS